MRSIWVRAGVAAALLVGAFIATVVVLGQTAYSPSGFVRGYVDALARKDIQGALRIAGPPPSSSALDDLLEAPIMAEIESYTTTESGSGAQRTVTVEYVANGSAGEAAFQVRQGGSLLGMFPLWEFADSPYAEIDLSVLHAREFTVNGFRLITPEQDVPSTYLAFTPGSLEFEHVSDYLEARPVKLVLGSPIHPEHVELVASANTVFRDRVQEQVNDYLDGCADQKVLYPIGCPFGQELVDRVVGLPQWSIVNYPTVTLNATTTPGEWLVPSGGGSVSLSAQVRSIYDGTISLFETTIPYRVAFVVTFVGKDDIVVTPQVG